MLTKLMSASAEVMADATRANTPLALLTVTTTPASNARTGSSAHSTAMKRSLSLYFKCLATEQVSW